VYRHKFSLKNDPRVEYKTFSAYILVHGFLIIFIRHFIERFKRPVNIHAISMASIEWISRLEYWILYKYPRNVTIQTKFIWIFIRSANVTVMDHAWRSTLSKIHVRCNKRAKRVLPIDPNRLHESFSRKIIINLQMYRSEKILNVSSIRFVLNKICVCVCVCVCV